MQNINNDSLTLIMTLLKLQNHDKKICDLFNTDYSFTFGELETRKDLIAKINGYNFSKYGRNIFRWRTEESRICIVIWKSKDAIGNYIELDEVLKHISFEDKV